MRLASVVLHGLLLLVGLGACSGSSEEGCLDLGNQACDLDACPIAEPYARACGAEAECPAPYECTTVEEVHFQDAGTRDVCLIPCDQACDCPSICLCNGVNGYSSWGPENYCACG